MPKRLLIKNVDAITLDAAGTILTHTQIAVEGRTIQAVGQVPADFQPDEVIDGYNQVAVPGFFNAHCHAPMTLVRGYAEDLPLDRWFNERIWVAESALTPEDVYWGAALAACEMIRSGCVGFNDMYFFMDRVAQVAAQAGLKASLTPGMFGIGVDKEVDLAGALAFVDRWNGQANGRLRAILGPHSPYICPPGFLRQVAEAARQHGIPIHIHLAETAEQVENSLKTYGLTPAAHLEALGVFDVPCLAAHALALTDADVELLARHDVTVAHCPITYMKLATPVNDLGRLLAAGVNVAIGTDGPGSNSDMDMKAAIRFTPLLQKYHAHNAEALPGDLPLRMATANGARALGFSDSGALEPGRAADIVIFDFDQPHLYPRHNLVANLIHSARAGDVSHVIVDGQPVYRAGEYLTLDVGRILAEAGRLGKDLVTRRMTQMVEYKH